MSILNIKLIMLTALLPTAALAISAPRNLCVDGRCTIPNPSCTGGTATLTHYTHYDAYPFADTKVSTYEGGKVGISNISRKGNGAGRFTVGTPELSPTECAPPNGQSRYRAEAFPQPRPNYYWDDGKSYWIGISYNPIVMTTAHTLLQVHSPNEGATAACNFGGNTFSIVPKVVDGVTHYKIEGIVDGRQAADSAHTNNIPLWTEPMAMNKWTDFVFNFTLSTKGAGYLKVWRNGELIIDRKGLTNVNYIDSCGNPIPPEKRLHNGPHVGVYGPSCLEDRTPSPHYREVLIDELRIAVGADGYPVVSPGCH